jgi:hypothetical protein
VNANSYNSPGTTGGNREDLRGPLTILEPEETPFISGCKKGAAPKSTLVEHGADRLRKPRLTGTREGASGPKGGNKAVKRARFGSYLHRWLESFGVTDVQQLISEKGGNAFVADEYGNAKAKTVREIKRDMEASSCGSQDGQGGSDDEMKHRGFFKWLDAAQTPQIPADFLCPAGQRITGQAALLESGANSLNAVLKSIKKQVGGRPELDGICGNDYQENADLFTRTGPESTFSRYRVQEQASAHEITLMVKVFNSSMARVNLIPSEFVNVDSVGDGNTKAIMLVSRPLWELLFLEELHAADDEEDAGGENGYVKAIGGLFCLEPRGNGYIVNSLN